MIICANPKAQYLAYEKDINEAILAVLNGDQYILGDQVKKLEASFANYIGVSSAIGVANGTDAIEIALRAMGIGQGDKVITVSHSAVATVAGIEATGASAVVVDLEKDFFTMDATLLEGAYSPEVRAVVAVHIYGQPSKIDEIKAFCLEKNVFLIEDSSQAHGARFKGSRVGSIGDVGIFSCYPTKNLGAIGDGGLIVTNNPALEQKMRMIREYGWQDRISKVKGRNSRLDELQAAILNVKLPHLDEDNQKRRRLADIYDQLGCEDFITPVRRPDCEHVFHLYVCRTKHRNDLIKFLNKRSIFPGIHYIQPIHLQPAYLNNLELGSDLLVTESICDEIISLPMYPELPLADAETVCIAIKEFLQQL